MIPSAVASTAATRAIPMLRSRAPVSSPLPKASWNHLVEKPDSGSVGVGLLFTEKISSTASGANRKTTNAQK